MAARLLSFPELKEHGVLLGRKQIDRLEAAGKFPKRVKLGEGREGRIGWVRDEIDAHVGRAIAGRSNCLGTLGSSEP